MYIQLNSNILKISSQIIKFPCSINYFIDDNGHNQPFILEVHNLLIVNFYPSTIEESHKLKENQENMRQNIWAFDHNGKLIWKIEEAPIIDGTNTYTSIIIKNNQLIAGSWAGIDYRVDLSDGSISPIEGVRPW